MATNECDPNHLRTEERLSWRRRPIADLVVDDGNLHVDVANGYDGCTSKLDRKTYGDRPSSQGALMTAW